jgi:chromosome segregation ATPase
MDKVIKMIDDMVALLGEEQKADDDKKAYCQAELDKSEDEYKTLVQEGNDLAKSIEDGTGNLKTLTTDIATMVQGIKDLDKQVADATKNRKEENEEYKTVMANDGAAKELLKMAKNRLNKFYNPKMYKPEAAASFVQVASDDAPPPPPEAVGAYQKKGGESNAVLGMVDALVADLDKEMQEMEVEEKDSQAEYEQLIKDSAEKRAADSKSVAEKEDAKADLEAEMEKAAQEKKAKLAEEMAKAEYLSDVHKDCDWLLENFDVRKEARAGEAEGLKNAKAVLSGADYSLF